MTTVNFVMLHVNWYFGVTQAARGNVLAGPCWVLLWVIIHLLLLKQDRANEALAIVASGIFGFAIDGTLFAIGILSHPENPWGIWGATAFMTSLWLSLATGFPHTLAWLRHRFRTAAFVGAVAGPLAYWFGSRLGAVGLPDPMVSLTLLVIVWAVAMPVLLWIRRCLDLDRRSSSSAG